MLGRVLYAVAFMLALPVVLALWAWRLDAMMSLPGIDWGWWGGGWCGWTIAGIGLLLMLWSFWSLWHFGLGLPMNAYPPKAFVSRGPYALLPHPIYVGFCVAVAGCAMSMGSPAGLWVVSPITALGCAALVVGYERDAIRRIFGASVRAPRLSFPEASELAPTPWHRCAALFLVLLPWLVVYEAVGHLPVPGAIDGRLALERDCPVLLWTEPLYASTYAMVVLAPLVALTRRQLRWFCHMGVLGTAVGALLYLVIPLTSPPRPFETGGFLAWMLGLERADGLQGRVAFPSFHVFWALTAARVLAWRWGRIGWLMWVWAAAIMVSCVTTGMHAVVDVLGGMVFAGVVWNSRSSVTFLVAVAQRVANSWREWRVGSVRVINHGLFAGLAAGVGMLVCAVLLDAREVVWIAVVTVVSLVGGGLWGQAFVGRANSSRPFGYFGAVIGASAGLIACGVAGVLDWRGAAALAVAAPWIQAIGRLRCLVQGCCHGAPLAAWWGIVYRHPRSRVCRVSGLEGVRVHPTPLYSMAGNVVIGMLLARLWSVNAPATFVVGIYFVFAGLLRFVEEHYRGEPHTRVVGGLRIYQWFAAVSVGAGMAVMCARSPTVGGMSWNWMGLAWAGVISVLYFGAMGVDFPESTRRFSRLT